MNKVTLALISAIVSPLAVLLFFLNYDGFVHANIFAEMLYFTSIIASVIFILTFATIIDKKQLQRASYFLAAGILVTGIVLFIFDPNFDWEIAWLFVMPFFMGAAGLELIGTIYFAIKLWKTELAGAKLATVLLILAFLMPLGMFSILAGAALSASLLYMIRTRAAYVTLFIVLLISAAIFAHGFTSDTTINYRKNPDLLRERFKPANYANALEQAIAKQDPSICLQHFKFNPDDDRNDQNRCIRTTAEQLKDFHSCATLTDLSRQTDCLSYAIIDIQDPELCEEVIAFMPRMKTYCYVTVAKNLKDPSVCPEDRKEICIKEVTSLQ
jgi:glucan phosphoethanolaminetransferase (alkaline phosphatase superfamily)